MTQLLKRRVLFLTGTRADFGKIKPLISRLQDDPKFECHVFVTGMHMLSKYGYTCEEVERSNIRKIHRFFNQNPSDRMDIILSKTIVGLSDYVREVKPDMIVVHGDRVEALAGAIVGALNNVLTAHVEGGEVSGTVDELIRHSVSKLCHLHFVANEEARNRLLQLGEDDGSVYVIGSPDIDVMNSDSLPDLAEAKRHYDIEFKKYGIVIFHPVTSEVASLPEQSRTLIDALVSSKRNYIVVYPNNDHGTEVIQSEYARLSNNPRFRIFPSMRFEFFLVLLRNAEFIIGNSSAGVREAPHYGVPAVNIGSRQRNRAKCSGIINVEFEVEKIIGAIKSAVLMSRERQEIFGSGNSSELFYNVVIDEAVWNMSSQKYFVDRLARV